MPPATHLASSLPSSVCIAPPATSNAGGGSGCLRRPGRCSPRRLGRPARGFGQQSGHPCPVEPCGGFRWGAGARHWRRRRRWRCQCPTRLPVAFALTSRCPPTLCSQPCGDQRRHQQRRWQRQRHLRPPHPVGRLLRGPRLWRCRRQRERRPPCVHPGWRLWRAVHGGQAGEPDLAARHQAQGEPLCAVDRQAPAAGCQGQGQSVLSQHGCQQHDSALPACWPLNRQPGTWSHPNQVTLIDQSDRFVFKPLLYELLSGAASEEEVAPSFAQLLAPYPVTFVQGRVASVQPEHATQVGPARTAQLPCLAHCRAVLLWDGTLLPPVCPATHELPLFSHSPAQDGGSTGGGTVVLADGDLVPYDWLVVSLGAETSTFGVPGVKENAMPFATFQDAQRVRGYWARAVTEAAAEAQIQMCGLLSARPCALRQTCQPAACTAATPPGPGERAAVAAGAAAGVPRGRGGGRRLCG